MKLILSIAAAFLVGPLAGRHGKRFLLWSILPFLLFERVLGQPLLEIQETPLDQVVLRWKDSSGSFRLQETPSLRPIVAWQNVTLTPALSGDTYTFTIRSAETQRFFRLARLESLTTIEQVSPGLGEAGVSVNRETIVHFSAPLAAGAMLNSGNFFAEGVGRRLLSRIELSTDRRKASLFYLEPLPASSRINVVFDGTGIKDSAGLEIDADRNGQPGGAADFFFDTQTGTAVVGTAVIGHVFASEPMPDPQNPGKLINRPLKGVTVTVDGQEQTLRAVTDATGAFKLEPAPTGRFFVHIDGRTADGSQWPDGAFYPFVGKAWEAMAGRTDNLAGGTGEIFLPLIVQGTLQAVSAASDTVVSFPPALITNNPELEGVSITVPANALFSDNGTRGGRVGIAPVPPDRLPGPLPPGLDMPLVITVQTDGPSNFDRPAPVCFPNTPDELGNRLPPGEKAALMSFNHDKGEWERVGSMTVSADGKLVCSDPGSGILQPGWHGRQVPDPNDNPGAPPPPPPPPPGPTCAPGGSASLAAMAQSLPSNQLLQQTLRIGKMAEPCDPPPPPPPCKGAAECQSHCDLEKDWNVQDGAQKFVACWTDAIEIGGGADVVQNAREICDQERDQDRSDADFADSQCREGCPPPCSGAAALQSLREGRASDLSRREILRAISAGIEEILSLYRPFSGGAGPVPESVQTQARELYGELQTLAGGDLRTFLLAERDRIEGEMVALRGQEGEFRGDQPPYPIHMLVEVLDKKTKYECRGLVLETNTVFSRLLTEPYAQYRIFLRDSKAPAEAFQNPCGARPSDHKSSVQRILFFDPRTKRHGEAFQRRIAGLASGISGFILRPFPLNAADADHDGLPDLAEYILGTDPNRADSDGDGLPDGFEIDAGLNPLDGRPAAVGILASVSLPGPALDVSALNDVVAVATGASGVAVFRTVVGESPVLVEQIDTPGNAVSVACDGNFIAAADGGTGLAIVEVTTDEAGLPSAAALARQVTLPGTATAVTSAGGVAYVAGDQGLIFAVDLATGRVLDQTGAGGRVHDLAIEGDRLFCLLDGQLRAFSLRRGSFEAKGTASLSGFQAEGITGRKRLFVGGGYAYATSYPGYDVVDVRDPAALKLVGNAIDNGPNSFKQIVVNGSGLGIAAVGINPRSDGTHDIRLYDVSVPADTTRYITTIPTPGVARALSLYGGQAYVADSESGLHLMNYLPFDTQGVPPTIELSASFSLNPAEVEETTLASISARVGDDVQVRNVEFYVDGTRVVNDGNLPFEHAFYAPKLTEAKTNFTVRARAFDTGGNSTWSQEFTVKLHPETLKPRIVSISPADHSIAGSITTLAGGFSEAIDTGSIGSALFSVHGAGPDATFNTADDFNVSGGQLSYNAATATLTLTFSTALSQGLYQATLGGDITDLAGNPLEAPRTWIFRAGDFADTDQDGIPDDKEASLGFDPLNRDTNGNGIPDGLEDNDGDGLPNSYEIFFGLDPTKRDTDGNGIEDGDEDPDDDRLINRREAFALTDPNRYDTDGDSWNDEAEVTSGSNPLDPRSRPRGMHFAPQVPHYFGRRLPSPGGVGLGAVIAGEQPRIVTPVAGTTGRFIIAGEQPRVVTPVTTGRFIIAGEQPRVVTPVVSATGRFIIAGEQPQVITPVATTGRFIIAGEQPRVVTPVVSATGRFIIAQPPVVVRIEP